MYIIQTRNLTKCFDNRHVVSDVNLNVKKGEIYGLLGLNGAGKTTIMKMLINLIKPTSGEIELFGQQLTPDSSHQVLGRIGSVIEYPIFYEKLTARENLTLHCEYMGYHDKQAIDQVLNTVELKKNEHKLVKQFSLGMKQRLGIARAIIHKPELLILDEPINGLDPIGTREIRSLFRTLSKEFGITLLISSHILAEIELIADTIGVISKGKLISERSMKELKEKNTEYIDLVTTDPTQTCLLLEDQLQITNYKLIDQDVIRIYDQEISQTELSKAVISKGIEIESINKKVTSLEEYFLDQMNKEL